MLCAGKQLRTDTPLHGRRCNIAAFKKIDPAFFDRLCKLFPQVHAAALYNESTKPLAELVEQAVKKHGRGWEGLYKYTQKVLQEPARSRAEAVLREEQYEQSTGTRKGEDSNQGNKFIASWWYCSYHLSPPLTNTYINNYFPESHRTRQSITWRAAFTEDVLKKLRADVQSRCRFLFRAVLRDYGPEPSQEFNLIHSPPYTMANG